jgi:transposase
MKAYAGIDLHSTNNFIGIMDEQGQRLYSRRLNNDPSLVLAALDPYKKDLEAVIVESTYNWYWLVDALQEQGYRVHLANPSAFKQYEGLKYTDDKWDAFWLADMKRLKILPEGYIYPKDGRPTRDLLRRRLMFVKHRTAHTLSLKSMITRNLGITLAGNKIQRLKETDVADMFTSEELYLSAKHHITAIKTLGGIVTNIEKEVKSKVKLKKEFKMLLTIPGIGDVLGLTIMLEVGDITRFPKVGNYSSYCRCVGSKRMSNSKKKGAGNRKNGNRYLSWAYVEASIFAARYCQAAQKYHQRKKAKTNGIVATKALSNKIARASYYIMRDQVPFEVGKLFT